MKIRNILKKTSCILLIGIVSVTSSFSDFSFVQISDRVFLITAPRQENNMIVFLSKKGLIIVDTFMSQSFAAEAKDIIFQEFGTKEVRFVINTHGHWDHFQGNQVFKEAVIVGHESIIEAMLESEEGRKQNLPQIKSRLDQMSRNLKALDSKSEEAEQLEQSLQYMNRLYTDLTGNYEFTPPSPTRWIRCAMSRGEGGFPAYRLGCLSNRAP